MKNGNMTMKTLRDFLKLLIDGGASENSPVFILNENGRVSSPAGFTFEDEKFFLEEKSSYDPNWHGSYLAQNTKTNNKGIRSPFRTSPDGGTSI